MSTYWRDEALCREADPEIFFPESGGTATQARKVCDRCPVRAECLEFALERREIHGIYAGLTTAERNAILKARGRASLPMSTSS
jgi:WhiB family redox-sensing transcriptional regulator